MRLVPNCWTKYVGESPIVSRVDDEKSWSGTPCVLSAVRFSHCMSYEFVTFSCGIAIPFWYEEDFLQIQDEEGPTCITKRIFMQIHPEHPVTITIGNHAFSSTKVMRSTTPSPQWYSFSINIFNQISIHVQEPPNAATLFPE